MSSFLSSKFASVVFLIKILEAVPEFSPVVVKELDVHGVVFGNFD